MDYSFYDMVLRGIGRCFELYYAHITVTSHLCNKYVTA